MVLIMSLSEALEEALTCANVPATSVAAVELARTYARLLDEPAAGAKYRIPLQHLAKVFRHYANTVKATPLEAKGLETAEATIVSALAEHSTTSDLGPKLAAILKELNLTLPAVAAPAKPEVARVKSVEPLDTERAEAQRLKIVR